MKGQTRDPVHILTSLDDANPGSVRSKDLN